jgi:F0F1-type ATP synthase assembly protein I
MHLGLVFTGCVLLTAGAGYWLDGVFEVENNWFFLGGLALGFVAGLYHLVKALLGFEKEEAAKKEADKNNEVPRA